jgi:hypothetical protein
MYIDRLDLPGRFNLLEQGGDKQDIGGGTDLGDQDGIELVTGLFDHIDDVAVAVVGIQPIDAHRNSTLRPVQVIQGLDDILARL